MGVDRGPFLAPSNSIVIVELVNTIDPFHSDKVLDALFFCMDLLLRRLMCMHTYCQGCIVQLRC